MRWRIWLAVALLATGAHLAHERVEQRRDAFPADVDVLYVPAPQYLRPMAVGYREALADLVWVRALIFSGERIGNEDLDAIDRYVDAVTGLAPRFERPYRWGGVTAVYGGSAAVTRDMADRSIRIYRKGLEQFPESHELLYALGMMLTHQVNSTPGYSEQERETLAAEGVEYIRRAAAFGADPLVRQYAATLVSDRADTSSLAIGFLQSQLAQAEDEDHRRMLRVRLERLGAKRSVQEVERIRDAFAAEQRIQGPYLSDTVYAVLRDEHVAPPSPSRGQTPDAGSGAPP